MASNIQKTREAAFSQQKQTPNTFEEKYTEFRRRGAEFLNKPIQIGRGGRIAMDTLQDIGYTTDRFIEGMNVPFTGGKYGVRNITDAAGVELPSSPATEGGQVAGYAAQLLPGAMVASGVANTPRTAGGRYYTGRGTGNTTSTGPARRAVPMNDQKWLDAAQLQNKKDMLMRVLNEQRGTMQRGDIINLVKQIRNIQDKIDLL